MSTDKAVQYKDRDETIYQKRKAVYKNLGYEEHEDVGTVGKVCTLTNKTGGKVVLTLLYEEESKKVIAHAK